VSVNLLFVYGTLRRGGSNDIARLVPQAQFICAGTLGGRLYNLGAYPALVEDPQGAAVRGEIYAVPTDGWAALDALEEPVCAARPAGEYYKTTAMVNSTEGTMRCVVYVANPARVKLSDVLEEADWLGFLGRSPSKSAA
jgi:gamma-glutamylcyclotransferase (GGCT)/AIG2-like uncharacterized protein YtfP